MVYWGSGEPKEADKETLKAASVALTSFEEFLALGRKQPADPAPAGPDETCTIMYTRCGGPTPELMPSLYHHWDSRARQGSRTLA